MSNGIQTSQRLHESHRKQAAEQENEILRAELATLRQRVAELEKTVEEAEGILLDECGDERFKGKDLADRICAMEGFYIERLTEYEAAMEVELIDASELASLRQRVAELEDAAEERFEELLTWNIEASVELKKCRARLAEYEAALPLATLEHLINLCWIGNYMFCHCGSCERNVACRASSDSICKQAESALRRLAGVVGGGKDGSE